MGTTATQMPPLSQAIVDPKTGLASINMALWQQELLRARQAWILYTPTTGHVSAISINDCAFQTQGKLVTVRIGLQGTTDGSALTVTLPFKAKSQNQAFNGILSNLAAIGVLGGDLLTLSVFKYDGTTPVNGTVVAWTLNGVYEAQ